MLNLFRTSSSFCLSASYSLVPAEILSWSTLSVVSFFKATSLSVCSLPSISLSFSAPLRSSSSNFSAAWQSFRNRFFTFSISFWSSSFRNGFLYISTFNFLSIPGSSFSNISIFSLMRPFSSLSFSNCFWHSCDFLSFDWTSSLRPFNSSFRISMSFLIFRSCWL